MSFFLNELSLHGQFNNVRDFLPALEEALKCREEINKLGFRLYCERRISIRPVFGEGIFQKAVMNIGNPNVTRSVMIWISKDGPFWDDTAVREHGPDDYFEYEQDLITDSSLAEAAFRVAQKQDCGSISFQPSRFQTTPLRVIWHKPDGQQAIEVRNFWNHADLQVYLVQLRPATNSWKDLIDRSKTDFPRLTFLDSLFDYLEGEPFNSTIANKATNLLGILNTLKACFDEKGNRTKAGEEIMDNYFRKENAIFSDESESNKNDFREQLTFTLSSGEKIFCPFHGKIRHRTFRLHFSWPIKHNEPLYIVYLGPKITKQ